MRALGSLDNFNKNFDPTLLCHEHLGEGSIAAALHEYYAAGYTQLMEAFIESGAYLIISINAEIRQGMRREPLHLEVRAQAQEVNMAG